MDEQLAMIPKLGEMMAELKAELKDYEARADVQWARPKDDRPSLWDFWRAASLVLPSFWKGAKETRNQFHDDDLS